MATLAESFLADLEDLEEDEEAPDVGVRGGAAAGTAGVGPRSDLVEALNYDDLDTVAPLVLTERFRTIVQARPAVAVRSPRAPWRKPLALARAAHV